MMINNIFLEAFTLINQVYTLPDYRMMTNLPSIIQKYAYVTKDVDLSTSRYMTIDTEYCKIYTIKNNGSESFRDTILIEGKPALILVYTLDFDHNDVSDIDKYRIDMIYNMYDYIFRFIKKQLIINKDSSLYKLIYNAAKVLTLKSEQICCSSTFDVANYITLFGKNSEYIDTLLKYDIEDLFVYYALSNIL